MSPKFDIFILLLSLLIIFYSSVCLQTWQTVQMPFSEFFEFFSLLSTKMGILRKHTLLSGLSRNLMLQKFIIQKNTVCANCGTFSRSVCPFSFVAFFDTYLGYLRSKIMFYTSVLSLISPQSAPDSVPRKSQRGHSNLLSL